MKCPDCKGSGEYIGARVVEDCQRCNGLGEIGPGASYEAEKRSKNKALDAMFKANKLPDWMKDHTDKIDLQPVSAKEIVEKGRSLLPELKMGDTIYIYDAGWHEATVDCISTNPMNGNPGMVYASAPCDRFRILYTELSYNVTQGRWEYIRAGTPVWP